MIAAEHAAAIARTPGLRLVRVIDRHADRARRLASQFEAIASTDPADLHREDVDAVIVCTSPESHVDVGVAALEAGKVVLIEKPVALDLASTDRLLHAADRAGLAVLVGQTARFQPSHLALAEQVNAGEIGRPRLAHVSWYAGHVWPGGWRSWQLNTARSGGHVLHNGVHAIDLLTWLVDDRPARVFARPLATWAPDMPTPDSFHIIIEFEHGALGVVELSYGLRTRGRLLRRVLLAGTHGTLCVSTDDEPSSDTTPPQPPAGVANAMNHQYAHFRDVLLHAAAPLTTPAQIRGSLAAAIAAQRSAELGEIVDTERPR